MPFLLGVVLFCSVFFSSFYCRCKSKICPVLHFPFTHTHTHIRTHACTSAAIVFQLAQSAGRKVGVPVRSGKPSGQYRPEGKEGVTEPWYARAVPCCSPSRACKARRFPLQRGRR